VDQGSTRFGEEKEIGPAPPDDLLVRIGIAPSLSPEDRLKQFDDVGEAAYQDILSVIPEKDRVLSVLDFGCGSGRIMRWFHRHPNIALTGCDIHAPTIEWMRSAYPDDTKLYVSDPESPLPEADESFDLVYCSSVFSHLPDWAPWLLELRRILKPGGILVASIHGRGFWDLGIAGSRGVPWDEDRTGLLVENYGTDFDTGWGPAVYVSEWWVREHWGRALEIIRYEPAGFGSPDDRETGQAWVVARRPEVDRSLDAEALQRPGEDPRELPAGLRAQWLAYDEIASLRSQDAETIARLQAEYAELHQLAAERGGLIAERDRQVAVQDRQVADQDRLIKEVLGSKSWKLTSPLRLGRAKLRP
jgi:SAM-dependent methyltransferase